MANRTPPPCSIAPVGLSRIRLSGGRRLDDPAARAPGGSGRRNRPRGRSRAGSAGTRSCPPPRRGRRPSCSPALVSTGSTWLRKLQGSSRSKSSTEIDARRDLAVDRRRERRQAVADRRRRSRRDRPSATRGLSVANTASAVTVADARRPRRALDQEPLPRLRAVEPRRGGEQRSSSPSRDGTQAKTRTRSTTEHTDRIERESSSGA